jgi:glutamate-1-semialdehyde 2,1-aminomutase
MTDTRTTDDLLAAARRALPGGTVHTYSNRPRGFPTFLDQPDFIVDRAEGAYLWTTDGERMLDMVLGAGTTLLGHGHPTVVDAVAAQVARGANFFHITPPIIDLATAVVDAMPGAAAVRFFNSGTEAMLIALRLVRAHTGRDRIIKLEGAYHGCLDEVLFHTSFGAVEDWAGDLPAPDSPGIPAGHGQRVVVVPYNDVDAMAEAAAALHDEVAAIIVEPIMRGLAPAPGYLAAVREIADRWRLPLIFDEVITGFRVALGGAQELYGVRADLTVLGKALGGGMPIGALSGTAELMAWLDPGQPNGRRILAEGSFYGNPVSSAAGLAHLRELRRPGVYPQLHAIGDAIGAGLRDAFDARRIPIQLTGVGPLVEFYASATPVLDYVTAQRTDQRPKVALAGGMRRRGVFGGGGRYNVSLAHGPAELALFRDAVAAVLDEDLAAG